MFSRQELWFKRGRELRKARQVKADKTDMKMDINTYQLLTPKKPRVGRPLCDWRMFLPSLWIEQFEPFWILLRDELWSRSLAVACSATLLMTNGMLELCTVASVLRSAWVDDPMFAKASHPCWLCSYFPYDNHRHIHFLNQVNTFNGLI